MSLATWKKEFYPVEARDAAGSDVEATEHSLRKWRGLTSRSLKKHNMKRAPNTSVIYQATDSPEILAWSAAAPTCALCQRAHYACKECPLYAARGGFACTDPRPKESRAPWGKWLDSGSTRPMVAALKLTLKHIKTKGTKKT